MPMFEQLVYVRDNYTEFQKCLNGFLRIYHWKCMFLPNQRLKTRVLFFIVSAGDRWVNAQLAGIMTKRKRGRIRGCFNWDNL